MPTVQGTDIFDHPINAGVYPDGFYGTPDRGLTPVPPLPSEYRLRLDRGPADEGVRYNLTGSPARSWAGFWYRTSSKPSTDAPPIANFQVPGGIGAVSVNSAGLFLSNPAGYAAATLITNNIWHWVEMIYNATTSTHQIYGRVNGVDMASPAAYSAGAAGTVNWHQLLHFAGFTEIGINNYADWKWGTAVSNTDWLGEPAELTLASVLPDADVVTTGWTTAPLFSKVNDGSDATGVTATAS